jgi:peptidoglycan hydrolase CwlO-like protein
VLESRIGRRKEVSRMTEEEKQEKLGELEGAMFDIDTEVEDHEDEIVRLNKKRDKLQEEYEEVKRAEYEE